MSSRPRALPRGLRVSPRGSLHRLHGLAPVAALPDPGAERDLDPLHDLGTRCGSGTLRGIDLPHEIGALHGLGRADILHADPLRIAMGLFISMGCRSALARRHIARESLAHCRRGKIDRIAGAGHNGRAQRCRLMRDGDVTRCRTLTFDAGVTRQRRIFRQRWTVRRDVLARSKRLAGHPAAKHGDLTPCGNTTGHRGLARRSDRVPCSRIARRRSLTRA